MLIALDTSTRFAGVALWQTEGLIAEFNWLAGREQTGQLLPEVQHLLERTGKTTADLTAVGVALGPGSFNGLRVGLSTAKAFALSLKIPLLAIPSLDAIAAGIPPNSSTLWTVLEAGRGRLAAQQYKARNGLWQKQGDFCSTSAEELVTKVSGATIICGELSAQEREILSHNLPKQTIVCSQGQGTRRASFIAEIAWRRFSAGEHDDIVDLEPLYMHAPVIGKPRASLLMPREE